MSVSRVFVREVVAKWVDELFADGTFKGVNDRVHAVLFGVCGLLAPLHSVYYQVSSNAKLCGLREVDELYDEVWWHGMSGDLGVVS